MQFEANVVGRCQVRRFGTLLIVSRQLPLEEMSREARARDIQAEIGGVLLEDWDPIGVGDVPEAADEYESYVGGVYHQIAAGVTAAEMAAYLRQLEAGFGLDTREPAELLPVARRLLAIDVSMAGRR